MPLLILTGDVNLMNVTDAAVPFARVGDELLVEVQEQRRAHGLG